MLTTMTKEELDTLPTGTIIRCEINEYYGTYLLIHQPVLLDNTIFHQWCTFEIFDYPEIEPVDDYTPDLSHPIEVIYQPEPVTLEV